MRDVLLLVTAALWLSTRFSPHLQIVPDQHPTSVVYPFMVSLSKALLAIYLAPGNLGETQQTCIIPGVLSYLAAN